MPATPASEEYVSISQAAKILAVSKKTLRRWESRGLISSTRTSGGHRRYALGELKKFRVNRRKKIESKRNRAAISSFLTKDVVQPINNDPEDNLKELPVMNLRFLRLCFAILSLVLAGVLVFRFHLVPQFISKIYQKDTKELLAQNYGGLVLADSISLDTMTYNINVPTNITQGLTVDGTVTIGDVLGVSGDTNLTGSLTVGGPITLNDLGTGLVSATGGSLGITTEIDSALLADGTIAEVDLSTTNDPTDNYVLSYDLGTGAFTWVAQTTDTNTDTNYWTDAGSYVYLTSTSDRLRLGASGGASALLHVGSSGTPSSIDGTDDVYIYDDLEVDGTIYGNISGTVSTGFTQGSVVFADSSGNLAEDNSNFFWDDTNNRLGIGTSTPSYNLDFGTINTNNDRGINIPVSADTDGDTVYGQYFTIDAGSTTPSTDNRFAYGNFFSITDPVGYDAGFNYLTYLEGSSYSIDSTADKTTYSSYAAIDVYNSDYSGNNTHQLGFYNTFYTGGTSSTAIGAEIYTFLEDETVDVAQTGYGIDLAIYNMGPLDTYYGAYVSDPLNYSTGGTKYGVYVDLTDPDSTNYGIYETGGATNYFKGDVGIGTSGPSYILDVTSSTVDEVAQFSSSDDLAQILISDNDTTGYINAKDSILGIGLTSGQSTSNLNINSSGNLGIGTVSPLIKLTVDSASAQIRLRRTGSTRYRADLNAGSTGLIINAFDDTGATYLPIRLDGSNFRFTTDGSTNRFDIDSSGNIVANETGADADFRIEGTTNQNLFFVE